MGYRSDVSYIIKFKTEASYRLFILEAKAKDLGACFNDAASVFDESECDDARYTIRFYAEHVKWYEGYPDVAMHNKLIRLAKEWADTQTEDSEHTIGWAYVRVGEYTNDNEEECGGFASYDWLQVDKKISRGD